MVKSRFSRKKGFFKNCPPAPHVWQMLRDWYKTPLGQRLDLLEQQQLAEILPDLFGYHICQLGLTGTLNLLTTSRISHHVVMDCVAEEPMDRAGFKGSPLLLPLRPDSVDVLILPHILEFTDYPHEVLREVERTLIPEGHIVILGFNPLSPWIIWRLMFAWRRKLPWCGRFYSTTRVKDWLALLGFDIELTHHYFYRPPVQHKGVMQKLRFIEPLAGKLFKIFGGCYVIVGRKRVETLTPIRTRWKAKKVVAGLVEPMVPHKKIPHKKTKITK